MNTLKLGANIKKAQVTTLVKINDCLKSKLPNHVKILVIGEYLVQDKVNVNDLLRAI